MPAVNRSLVVLAILASSFAGCSRTQDKAAAPTAMPAIPVRGVAAVATDVPLEISAIGNVEAISTVDVKARITAPVLRVHFQEGQDVRKGELLFELDPETYISQIAELEANLAKDSANEKQSQANIEKDKSTLKNAQSIADRGKLLNKDGIFSREQTDQVVSNADSAKASLDADQAGLESAQASNKADAAKLAQTRLLLSYTKIYAPINGRAGAIQVKQGNLAKENDAALVTLLQVFPVYVTFSVPENLLPEIRRFNASRPLAVQAKAADGTSTRGVLRFIDNTVDTTTGTIKLKAAFENPARTLWPGQFVNVQAELSLERGRIIVPSQTIQTGPRGKFVWVMNADSTAGMRQVQVLRNFTPAGRIEQAVIGSGLNAGEMVVSEGQLRLAPGAKVRLLQPSGSPS